MNARAIVEYFKILSEHSPGKKKKRRSTKILMIASDPTEI
jgi:hypothetical protein